MWRIEREGDCNKCGDCCESCEFLQADRGDGQRLCAVYAHRPEWCNQDYPRSFDTLSPRCGFRFTRVSLNPLNQATGVTPGGG